MPAHIKKRCKTSSAVDRSGREVEHSTARKSPILELPTELWMEILSYFPAVPIPYLRPTTLHPVLPPRALERIDALKALSQTCRALRTRFLAQFWERFEVCAIRHEKAFKYRSGGRVNTAPDSNAFDFELHDPFAEYGAMIPGSWYLDVSRFVKAKSDGLIQNPEYATLVRTVNVVLTRCDSNTVLPAFSRCLEVLPNLRTLQILRAHTQMTTHLKRAFERRSFPSVQTVILPSHAHNILRCCKEVRVVICNYGDGSKLVTAIAKECKKVEILEGFMPDEKMMKRIIKAVPNLRKIKLMAPAKPSEALRILSSLKHLSTIEIRTDIPRKDAVTTDPGLVTCIRVARDVLREMEGKTFLSVCHESYTESSVRRWVKQIDTA